MSLHTELYPTILKGGKNKNDETVICRWWIPSCAMAWATFILYEVGIGLDRLFGSKSICPYSDDSYGDWYWYTNYLVLGGFCLIWIMLLMKVFQMKPGPARAPHLTALNIVTMGTIATVLALVWNWGGVCIDVLGVASPAAIWGEWIACGPLLIFITVTVVDKPALTKMDWFLMITFFLCMIFGWCIIPEQPYAWGVFWLMLSILTYIPLLYLPYYMTKSFPTNPESVEAYSSLPTTNDEFESLSLAHLYEKRYNLSLWLTIILPFYTLNYILAWAGVIDAAVTIVVYQLLSVLTKGLFAALCMDAHVDVLTDAERAVERRANVARRAFLKYIFHEVRTPLNSLTMGIEILQMSENLNEEDMESLVMMKGASEFMSDTLNDVLSMQKIEEGKLELDLSPFSIKDAINKVFLSLRGASSSKHITLQMEIGDGVPDKVIGDRYRIEHVISNLVSNAIKFTPESRTVRVVVSSGGSRNETDGKSIIDLTVAITDQGIGISPENQRKLFNNFVQIRPGALQQGQGSGLGLSLCKQIVTLHGGTIGVQSVEGQGSSFSFTIPFGMVELPPSPVNGSIETRIDRIKLDSPMTNSITTPFQEEYCCSGKSPKSVVKVDSTRSVNGGMRMGMAMANAMAMAVVEITGVLVVDDVESNRKMLMMLLRKNGIEARTAKSGQEALDLIRMNMDGYKLVFMDNLMPVMNGVDATRILRQEGYRNIIVGVTGNVLEDDLKEYLAAGADFVIGKPLKMHQLDKVLRHVRETNTLSNPGMRLMESSNRLEWANWSI